MANAFVAMCYATAKKAGVDTSKMSPDDVIEWYNKQQGKKEAKEKGKEIIKDYFHEKSGLGSGNKQPVDDAKEGSIDSTIGQKNKYYKETIDRTDENVLQSKMSEITNRLIDCDVEHNVLIDKDGHIYEKVGDEDYVEEIGVNMDGGIDIHNHIDNISFSSEDIKSISKNKNTQFVLATKNCIYKAKLIKELDLPMNEIRSYGLQKALDCGEEELMKQDKSNAHHYSMEYLKEKGYIEYEKIDRNSRV